MPNFAPELGDWSFWQGCSTDRIAVGDVQQLDDLLRQAAARTREGREIAELTAAHAGSLAVGLAGPDSVATFSRSYDQPPYYVSRGARKSGDKVVFFYDGHWTEFDSDALIDESEAAQAIRDFFETEQMPTGVRWAEV